MSNVYFLKAGNYIKIGKANNVQKRLRMLQIGNHNHLEVLLEIPMNDDESAHKLEKKFHTWFYLYRTRGEWFRYARVIQSVIEEIKNGDIENALPALDVAYRFFSGSDVKAEFPNG
jgi:hypothetical protein